MSFPIRARLTLFFTVMFGIIVGILATGAYFFIRSDLYGKLDTGLRVTAEVTAISANHELIEHSQEEFGDADIQAVLNGQVQPALPQMQILVRQGGKNVAYKRSGPHVVDIRTLPIRSLKSGQTVQELRICERELAAPQFHTTYQIYTAESIDETMAQLWTVKRELMLFVPLGLALAAWAGYLAAGRSLAPLKELTDRIGRITSAGLSDRVPVKYSRDEIGSLATGFNALLDRLEAAFNLQRRFMADASHELRTPITVALTATQSAIRDPLRTALDSNEALALVEEQMLRLRRIVSDMLFLSQADASSLRIFPADMYLDDVVAAASRAAQTLAKAKGQLLKVENLPEARCFGDEDLLRQAVMVLLDNAVKFTPEGGQVSIAITPEGNQWACSVSDSGPGIPVEMQERIFDRFFRVVQPSGPTLPGAGLGLAIARSIVEAHQGTLQLVESRPGHTEFQILLPALSSESDTALKAQAKSLAVRM